MLRAARQAVAPEARVIAVHQPHRYTRTRDLMDDFASVLSEADLAIVLEVYAAGEDPIAGADVLAELATIADVAAIHRSPSTVHTSAVDETGLLERHRNRLEVAPQHVQSYRDRLR